MSKISSHNTSDKPREACGVFGLYSRELAGELAQRTYFGLYALQHRGQESAGIAVSDGVRTTAVRDMGLVSQVFDEARLAALEAGHISLGHVRYSTTGSASWEKDRKSTRLNSSHANISYAVFCLKKNKQTISIS